MSGSNWSRLTMDHMIGSDWSIGDVHVTGTLLLVGTGEGLYGEGMFGTCTQGRVCSL